MTLRKYMKGTEYAIKQLFESLQHYQKLIEDSIPPSFDMDFDTGDNKKDFAESFDQKYKDDAEFREKQDAANENWDEYLAVYMAHASICGSILQMAHMAISQFSTYDGDCEVLSGKHKRFGIGRKVNNLTIGLIIYAGRNQYNHWDDERMNPKTKEIFDKIATSNGATEKDPAFDLDDRKLDIYSHNIVGLLEWRTYADYERDIIEMLLV